MRSWSTISLLLLSVLAGCTKVSERVVILPDDRTLPPVYDAQGERVLGRSAISDSYLRELEQDLEACSKLEERAR